MTLKMASNLYMYVHTGTHMNVHTHTEKEAKGTGSGKVEAEVTQRAGALQPHSCCPRLLILSQLQVFSC